MRTYPIETRSRAVAAVRSGHSVRVAALLVGASRMAVWAWCRDAASQYAQ